jgi:hypothetical protein
MARRNSETVGDFTELLIRWARDNLAAEIQQAGGQRPPLNPAPSCVGRVASSLRKNDGMLPTTYNRGNHLALRVAQLARTTTVTTDVADAPANVAEAEIP